MFIVPCIMTLGGPATLWGAIGTLIYGVQIILIFVLIYRLGSFIAEWISFKQKFKKKDQELYLDELLNEED